MRTLWRIVAFAAALWLLAPVQAQDGSETVEEALKRLEGDIVAKVEEYRGLKFKMPVKIGLKTQQQLKAASLEQFEKEVKPEEWQAYENLYERMGLIPRDYDMKQGMIDLLGDAVAGYYDAQTKLLYMVNGDEKVADENAELNIHIVVAHELCHALEDQYFDLRGFDRDDKGNMDRALARRILTEGTASLIGFDHLLMKTQGIKTSDKKAQNLAQFIQQNMWNGMTPKVRAVPDILKLPLMLPYYQGTGVLQDQMKKGMTWAQINELLLDPPVSSEQMMHAEKYFTNRRDYPATIDFSSLAGALPTGWNKQCEDTMGEYGSAIFLAVFDRAGAMAQAYGWDGDRILGFGHEDGRSGFAWYTVWDSDKDAKEFFDAYVKTVGRRYADKKVEVEDKGVYSLWATEADYVVIKRENNAVAVLEGAPKAMIQPLFEELWKSKVTYDNRDRARPEGATTVEFKPRQPEDWVPNWKYEGE